MTVSNKPVSPSTKRSTVLPGIAAAVLAMIVLQLGVSLSKPAMEVHGAPAITWLRLLGAAFVLGMIARPAVFSCTARQWRTALTLGAAMAAINLCFYQSLLYLPVGVAAAIEFIGPLAVSAFYLVRVKRLLIIWPILAGIGVTLLTAGPAFENQSLSAVTSDEIIGFGWAIAAACGWGSYVVLMKRVGSQFSGLDGLAMSLLVAAVLSAPFGLIDSGAEFSFDLVLLAFGLAILVPLLPYVLEMQALRRMHPRLFGMLMGMEPAIAVLMGWLVLGEVLTLAQLAGVACVTVAMLKVAQLKAD